MPSSQRHRRGEQACCPPGAGRRRRAAPARGRPGDQRVRGPAALVERHVDGPHGRVGRLADQDHRAPAVRAAIAAHPRVVGVEHRQRRPAAAPRPARPWPRRSPRPSRTRRCAPTPTLSTTPTRGGAISAQVARCARRRGRPSPAPGTGSPRRPAAPCAAAQLVVERAGAAPRSGRAAASELGEQVLGGGLAGRAGQADDGQVRAAGRAPRGPARPSAAQRVVDDDRRHAVDRPGAEHRHRARRRPPSAAKSCPSTFSPANATNRPPGPTLRESNSTGPVTTRRPGRRRRACRRPPPRSRRASSGSSRPTRCRTARRSAAASSTRSSNGMRLAGDLLAALVPLAQHRDHVARAGQARPPRRSPPAARRPRSTCGRGRPLRAPASTSARIARRVLGARVVVGDDHQVGAARPRPRPSAAACPGPGRRRRRSRRSAGRPGRGQLAQRGERGDDRVGLVRVVDDAEHRAGRVDPLQPAGHARGRRRSRRPRSRGSTPTATSSASASSALATLCRPGSATPAAHGDAVGPVRGERAARSRRRSTSTARQVAAGSPGGGVGDRGRLDAAARSAGSSRLSTSTPAAAVEQPAPWPRSSRPTSAWKSRWSRPKLVKPPTANRTPPTRPSASAWLDTSITTAVDPALDRDGEQRVQVGGLGRGADAVDDQVAEPGLHRADQAGDVARRRAARPRPGTPSRSCRRCR